MTAALAVARIKAMFDVTFYVGRYIRLNVWNKTFFNTYAMMCKLHKELLQQRWDQSDNFVLTVF